MKVNESKFADLLNTNQLQEIQGGLKDEFAPFLRPNQLTPDPDDDDEGTNNY